MTKVSRAQVIAYRVAAHGLHREATAVGDLAILDIGVQEAMGQPAALAWAARLDPASTVTPTSAAVGPGHRLAMVWSLRGAPHVHRRKDLDGLAAALYPLSEADATGRLNETGPSVKKAGIAALEQYGAAVAALREVVTTPTAKGAASTAVTRRIPEPMRRACRPCKTDHISDSAMRLASLTAGLEIEPGTSPPVLAPRRGAAVPDTADLAALGRLAHAYLRLLGPATVGEFAGYVEGRRADVAAAWPHDLAEVSVDGRTAYLPADRVDALRKAPDPAVVRLIGPFDPYLQARDRFLLVPDKARHKKLWPVLGRPGVLLVDGEVAGTWRTKASGQKLTITVESFGPLPKSAWAEVDTEAERVATARGSAEVVVTHVD